MPVNRQTVPRAEREAEILDAAQAEFSDAGFEDATVAAIARRAGMTAANVHYYFPTKDALVSAVAARAFEQLFASLDSLPDPIDRLHAYVDFHLANHRLRGQLQVAAAGSPELTEVLQAREAWLGGAAAAAVGGPGLDADLIAATVTGLIEVITFHPDPHGVLQHAVLRLTPESVQLHE